MDCCSGRPPDDLPGEQVHHDGKVEPPLPRADIRDIRDPDTVWAADVEID